MDSESNVVQTEYGKVRGTSETTLLGVPYVRFLGIPYATPPLKNLRFKSPLKLEPWGDNIIDAFKEASPCAGKNNIIKQYVGSDDCLYLNIFTKNLSPKKPQAVMVYIHGGGFNTGSSTLNSYSPDYILLADVVLVTINYRIGPLGFLTLRDEALDVPGNAGLKDQVLAMKFVKENIHNFGGDPNNVTLAGHSSGATCVSLHCVAESSRELFNRALVMSGSPVGAVSVFKDDNYALKLAQKLGYEGNSDSEVLAFLENADALAMAEAQTTLKEDNEGPLGPLTFGPCIEPYDNGTGFMLCEPIDVLRGCWSQDIDLMIGGTADEGLSYKEEFENDTDYVRQVPEDIKCSVSAEKLKEFASRLKRFYQTLFPTEIDAHQKANGDMMFWFPMQRFIHSRLVGDNPARTFLYRFAVDSPTQNHYRNRWFGKGSKGVVHADELSYLWKNNQGDVPDRDSIEFLSVMRFTCLLMSFVMTGDPNSNVLNLDFKSFYWKPVEFAPFDGLNIDKTLEFKTLEESKRLQLFESMYREASVRLF